MLTNKQIFSNELIPIDKSSDIVKTGHDVSSITFDHASILLIFLIGIIIFLGYTFYEQFKEAFCFSSS